MLADLDPANAEDAPALVALRDEVAERLVRAGIRQWEPGQLGVAAFERMAAAGELFVVREASEIVAAVRLTWADPDIWGDDPDRAAGYVHGLMVRSPGTGLGSAILRWCAGRVVAAGRSRIRLDCVKSNAALCDYYRRQGFAEVGEIRYPGHDWATVTKFEKACAAGS